MTEQSQPESERRVADNKESVRGRLALVISNAYLARGGMAAREVHAPVDEDIADAILAAGFRDSEAERDAALTGQVALLRRIVGLRKYASGLIEGAFEAPATRAPARFLAITEECYDRSTVHGIYGTFAEARDDIERRALLPDEYLHNAVIQEWTGGESGKTWERVDSSIKWEERGW